MPSKTEWIERRSLEALHEGASEAVRAETGLVLHQVDGASVSVCAAGGGILINRVIGLGLNGPATAAGLQQIRRIYAEAGVPRFFVHVSPEAESENEIRDLLKSEGYEKARGWMKFSRDNAPATPTKSDLTVRLADASHKDDFARICGTAFGIDQAVWPVLCGLIDHPNWHLYMSFDGDAAAGCGGLYVEDGTAVTDYGATDPQFRQRGSQSAILTARIEHARELGVTLITTETGEAVEGDAQHSYGNILKRGFKEDYLRENWAPIA